MALTEKNRAIIYSRVQDLETRLKLTDAVEMGNIDDIVLDELLVIFQNTRELIPNRIG